MKNLYFFLLILLVFSSCSDDFIIDPSDVEQEINYNEDVYKNDFSPQSTSELIDSFKNYIQNQTDILQYNNIGNPYWDCSSVKIFRIQYTW
jgi:hypothetical protein